MGFQKGHKQYSHLISTKVSLICIYCGKEYIVDNYRKDKSKYCCKECSHLDRVGKDPANKGIKTNKPAWNTGLKGYKSGADNCNFKGGKPKCIDCGKELVSYKAKRCIDCNKKWQVGENVYNFIDGLSKYKERTTLEYKTWRVGILKRDLYTCMQCGCKGEKLEVHHIITVKKDKTKMLDMSNGITLCVNCHKRIRAKEEEYEQFYQELLKNKLSLTLN